MRFALLLITLFVVALVPVSAEGSERLVFSSSGSPYFISGTFVVPSGSELVVEPGVEVQFARNASILAYGRFVAIGTKDAPIIFTSDSSMPTSSYWLGVRLLGGGVVENATIEYAQSGLKCDSPSKINNVIAMTNLHGVYATSSCSITNLTSEGNFVGVYLDHAQAKISDCSFTEGKYGVYLYGAGAYAELERVYVHDMQNGSCALTSICNRAVVRDSAFDASVDVYVPSIMSNLTFVNTSFYSTRMGFHNALHVYNNVRAIALDESTGAPLEGAHACILDRFSNCSFTTSFDGTTPWASMFDWSWDNGASVNNNVTFAISYADNVQERAVNVSFMREEKFYFATSQALTVSMDVHREILVIIDMEGKQGNELGIVLLENGNAVDFTMITRTSGAPDEAILQVEMRDGISYSIELSYYGEKGANPVHVRIGDREENIVFNSEFGHYQKYKLSDDSLQNASGRNYTFDASGSRDAGLEYQWDFGDGCTASGLSVNHEYMHAGAYMVSLRVTDDCASAVATMMIVVA